MIHATLIYVAQSSRFYNAGNSRCRQITQITYAYFFQFFFSLHRKVAICVVVASKRPTPEVQLTAMLGLIGLALPMHFAVSPHGLQVPEL